MIMGKIKTVVHSVKSDWLHLDTTDPKGLKYSIELEVVLSPLSGEQSNKIMELHHSGELDKIIQEALNDIIE